MQVTVVFLNINQNTCVNTLTPEKLKRLMPVMHVDLQVTYVTNLKELIVDFRFHAGHDPGLTTSHTLLLSILPDLTSYFVAVVIISATRGRHLTT